MIEILSDAQLATVQDFGRFDQRRFGVGTSGAMDRLALAAGNILLGNAEDAAGIEVPVFPFGLRIEQDLNIAVTGADARATLDGAPLPPWWRFTARAGQELELRPPRRGARTYVTVSGGIDLPRVLGSRATQMRGAIGGLEGRALRRGDRLPAGRTGTLVPPLGAVPPGAALALPAPPGAAEGDILVRVLPTGEYPELTSAAQSAFWQSGWTVTPQSNRAGYRLGGPVLETLRKLEMRSYGVVPGLIQLPPGGAPIIQLSDANATGGYPKLGTVIEADLWRLGQAPIGATLRFLEVDYADARAAWQAMQDWLSTLRRHARWQEGAKR
jgi:biotin-dependent carboxylase-like uncharacterized protein